MGSVVSPAFHSDSSQFIGQTVAPYGNVQLPDINQMKVNLNKLVQQGQITPDMAQTFLQQASAYNQIDPRDIASQRGALSDLQNVIDTRGMDPQARAALYQAQQANLGQERGEREAIMQNAAARGIGGSGLELASKLANQQGSANRGAAAGYQAAGDAANRRLAAIQGAGQLGGQIYGEEAQAANAQNAINQFNALNSQNTENMNVAARNAAQAQNLSEKQRIADTNASLGNQQQLYNKGLYQQNFANQMALAGGQSGAAAEAAKGSQDQTNAAMGMFNPFFSDEEMKTDIKPGNPSEFLEKIKPYSFKYKDPSNGPGRHLGVMAQDMEKAAPQSVIKTSKGKMINPNKSAGEMLASLASIHQRLKKLERK